MCVCMDLVSSSARPRGMWEIPAAAAAVINDLMVEPSPGVMILSLCSDVDQCGMGGVGDGREGCV